MSVPAEEEEEVVFLGKVEAEDEEQSLTEQLEQQQAQLDAINEQLAVDPSSEDLQQLKGSLDELVGLLKGELLRVKKAKLLSVVEAQFGSSSSSSNQPQQNNVESKKSLSESSSSSSSSSSEEESTSLSAIIEQFNGQECSVPFGASDQYHDAILKVENEGENLLTPESLLFNAFFLYPLTQSMLTCPFYLKGSCRFTSSSSSSTSKKTCKYSHGHRVTVQQIRPKAVYSIGEEVNYHKDGDNCNRKLFGLVRNSALPATSTSSECSKDDHHHHHLWTRCEIVKTDPGTGRVLVKLVRDCTDFWVPMEMLVLVDQQFEKEEEDIEVPAMMSSQTESSNTNSATPSSSFGEWERYTSGIGSKLLLKMGYTSGTGLGSRAQGILHPIESYVFPPGHSLDACFTLKAESERKKLDIEEVMKEKKKERRLEAKRAKQYEKAVEKSREKAENDSVFRLLDDMFHSGSSSASTSTSASSSFGSSKKQKVKSELSRNQTKNLDAKSLALSAFKVDEELKKAEAELRRYEESFRRNSKGTPNGKSAEVQGDLGLKTIQQKRDRAKAVVDGLRRRQAELGRETTLRKDKQKMIF